MSSSRIGIFELGIAVCVLPVVGVILGASVIIKAIDTAASSWCAKKKADNEEKKRKQEEAEHAVSEAWNHTKQELSAEAAEITNAYERENIIASINASESRYKKALTEGDSSSAVQIISSIREKNVHTSCR